MVYHDENMYKQETPLDGGKTTPGAVPLAERNSQQPSPLSVTSSDSLYSVDSYDPVDFNISSGATFARGPGTDFRGTSIWDPASPTLALEPPKRSLLNNFCHTSPATRLLGAPDAAPPPDTSSVFYTRNNENLNNMSLGDRLLNTARVRPAMEHAIAPDGPLATRYIYVYSLSKNATISWINTLIVSHCIGLRGYYTASLKKYGSIVLSFHDIRDGQRSMTALERQGHAVMYIRRDEFSELADQFENPLLSPSEGFLIVNIDPQMDTTAHHPMNIISCFGDVKNITPKSDALFIVEYFDDRCVDRAKSTVQSWARGTYGILSVEGMFDAPMTAFGGAHPLAAPPPRAPGNGNTRNGFGSGNTLAARTKRLPPRMHQSSHGGNHDKIPAKNMIAIDRIEQGLDMRTTLMLKNIPNRMTDLALMNYIEEVVGRAFDFFYLRIDFSNECNVGYGFVNFINTRALLAFVKARVGTRWNLYHSDKVCLASYANIQGKESLVDHFRNSSVLEQIPAFRPKLFYSSGPKQGEPEPFPESDDPRRKARSAANVASIGLFPSSPPTPAVDKTSQADVNTKTQPGV